MCTCIYEIYIICVFILSHIYIPLYRRCLVGPTRTSYEPPPAVAVGDLAAVPIYCGHICI